MCSFYVDRSLYAQEYLKDDPNMTTEAFNAIFKALDSDTLKVGVKVRTATSGVCADMNPFLSKYEAAGVAAKALERERNNAAVNVKVSNTTAS
jgi:hypothetical protein